MWPMGESSPPEHNSLRLCIVLLQSVYRRMVLHMRCSSGNAPAFSSRVSCTLHFGFMCPQLGKCTQLCHNHLEMFGCSHSNLHRSGVH